MHSHAPYVVTAELNLARVDTCAYLEAETGEGIPHDYRAADGAGRTIEGRQQPIAGALDQPSPEAFHFFAGDGVVNIEKTPPFAVPESAAV